MSRAIDVLRSGVRYRFATGLRAAMRLWGALLVALVVAIGLEAKPPLLPMAAWWSGAAWPLRVLTFAGLAVSVFPLVRQSMRDSHIELLPVSPRERFSVDGAALFLFLLPVYVVMAGCIAIAGGPGRALEAMLYGVVVAGGLAAVLPRGMLRPTARREAGASTLPVLRSFSYDFRWLVRMARSRLLGANVLALLALGCTELAIRNNDVTRFSSIARIALLFAACAAMALAAEIVRARNAARPFRAVELSLPVSSAARVRALLAATFMTAAPMLLVCVLLRPVALPYAVLVLAGLVLFGEFAPEGLVLGTGAAAAVMGAVDARVALVAALVVVPLCWRRAAA
ncbi:MAG TPA: hypothetical protein VGF69_12925 [Thermoanaerobaculia bacterium]